MKRSSAHDIAAGIGGVAVMAAAFLTPFSRKARSHWGLDAKVLDREFPGDELIMTPRWGWTHGIDIDGPPGDVWPWIAQLGSDRGGFYSYPWLENVAGCDLSNATKIHPEWQIAAGGELVLHPKMPPLHVIAIEQGHYFVVRTTVDASRNPWPDASWLFLVEPLGAGRSRLISRYRCGKRDHFARRLGPGPLLLEPIGFAMDRRMLLGIKERVERRGRNASDVPHRAQRTLRGEHDSIVALTQGVMKRVVTGDHVAVAAAIADLRACVRAHLDNEERSVLPDYARHAPHDAAVLLAEHEKVRLALDDLDVAVDLPLVRATALEVLLERLRTHAAREEAGLYAWVEGGESRRGAEVEAPTPSA